MRKAPPRVFVSRFVGGVLEIWLPPLDDPEGERVTAIDATLVPALIATLKQACPHEDQDRRAR